MKITITQDFDSVEQAAEFLVRVGNPAHVVNKLAGASLQTASSTDGVNETKPARKPRSDAGKPREPYGPRDKDGGAPASAPVAADAGQAAGASDSKSAQQGSTPAAAATDPSAPAPATALPKVGENATPPAAEEFPATLDGARKAMKALDQTPGKGMDACIAALKAHGVLRISDLKPEQHAGFIKDVLGQSSPEGIKKAVEWSASAKAKK